MHLLRGTHRALLAQRGTPVEVAAWAAAVTAIGGTYSAATLNAVSKFVKSAKANGYWSKLIRINLFAGGGGSAAQNFAGALVPLKAGGGTPTDTNVNFVSGDYSEATGLTGNGTTKYLKTGLIPSTSLTLNSTHMGLYNRGALGSKADMGASGAYYLNGTYTDGKIYQQMGAALVSGVLAHPPGMLIATRSSAAAQAAYRRGVLVASDAGASGALPTTEFYVGALNNGSNVATSFSTAPIGAYSIGLDVAAEALAYSTDMQTFQVDLGRAV